MKKLLVSLIILAAFGFVAMCYADDAAMVLPSGWGVTSSEQQADSRLDKLIQEKVIPIEPAQVNDWKTEANTKFTPYVGAGAAGPAVPEHVVRPVAPIAPGVPSTPKLP